MCRIVECDFDEKGGEFLELMQRGETVICKTEHKYRLV